MVSDVPTSEQMSERSGEKRASERGEPSKAERGRANERASGALRSEQVSNQVLPGLRFPLSQIFPVKISYDAMPHSRVFPLHDP